MQNHPVPRLGYTTMTCDLMHAGHVRFLQNCKLYCDRLIVGLVTDELAAKQKRQAWFDFSQRKALLDGCKYVDGVVAHRGDDKVTAYEKLHFHVLFIGDEYYGQEEYQSFSRAVPSVNVVYLPSPESVRTSELIHKWEDRFQSQLTLMHFGVGGGILRLGDLLVKPVCVGVTEGADPQSTGNVYDLPVPPPRNWKRWPPPPPVPNLCGVNSMREIAVQSLIQGYSWNPVRSVRLVFQFSGSSTVYPRQEQFYHITLERATPKRVYWLQQEFAGSSLDEWIVEYSQHPQFETVWKTVCTELERVLSELRELCVIHGDMHPANICVKAMDSGVVQKLPTAGGSLPKTWQVSVIDFGWCLHESFTFDEDERAYYEACLQEHFDTVHFIDSLKYLYRDQPYFPMLNRVAQALLVTPQPATDVSIPTTEL